MVKQRNLESEVGLPEERQTHEATGGLGGMLRKLGVDTSRINTAGLGNTVGRAREYARSNPGIVLGGLAATAIGLGLMRKRRMHA